LLPLVGYLVWLGGLPFVGLVSAMVVLGLIEFYEMLCAKGERPYRVTGILAGLLIVWYAHFREGLHANLLLTTVLLVLITVELGRRDNRGALHNISGTVFGVIYVAWFGCHLVFLRNLPELTAIAEAERGRVGAAMVYLLLMCAWGSDTGAYVIGTLYGRHRLLPRVSPSKSIEGAIGGLVAGGFLGWLAVATFVDFLPAWAAVLIGFLIAVTAQLGDMAESLLKRDTARKDSAVGMIIPGHGGVLDRFDSVLFSAPVLYYVLKAVFL
jgi:phosphatidate cytidylyltransferase